MNNPKNIKNPELLKSQQLRDNSENSEGTYLTTSTGVRISDTDNDNKF